MGSKICTKCKKEKPLSDFTYRKDTNRYVSYCKQCANEKSKEYVQSKKNGMNIKKFVYKLLDKDFNVLYVGKTWDLKRRTFQHLNPKSSLFSKEDIEKIKYVSYLLLNSEIQGDLREIYYIAKYRPPFNKQYNYEYEDNNIGITMKELEWRTFNITDLKDVKILEIESSESVVEAYIDKYELTGKEVIQIDKNTNQPIAVYQTGGQASRETGVDDGTIYKVLTKQRRYAGGYKWIKLSEWLLNK